MMLHELAVDDFSIISWHFEDQLALMATGGQTRAHIDSCFSGDTSKFPAGFRRRVRWFAQWHHLHIDTDTELHELHTE